jgi:CobQ-like glutamine amidotransferase family enzyme
MKIEILYPELCCLYGDKGNTKFLQQCLPEAEFIYTQLNEKPHFLTEEVDLCCMYSMSEQSQELILSRLMPYQAELNAAFAGGKTLFLLTGNALELLGSYIQREDGSKVDALGMFETYSVRQAPNRFNTLIQAEFEGMTLLGYTSRFSHTYGVTENLAMSKVTIGTGCEPKSKLEGIRSGRVIATYSLGPVLVANPDFAKWLLKELGIEEPQLPFEADLYKAYEVRKQEFTRPDLELD